VRRRGRREEGVGGREEGRMIGSRKEGNGGRWGWRGEGGEGGGWVGGGGVGVGGEERGKGVSVKESRGR